MGYMGLYMEDWFVEVERHWVAWDCCCCRRSLDDFSNRVVGIGVWVSLRAWVVILEGINLLHTLEMGLTLSSYVSLNTAYLT